MEKAVRENTQTFIISMQVLEENHPNPNQTAVDLQPKISKNNNSNNNSNNNNSNNNSNNKNNSRAYSSSSHHNPNSNSRIKLPQALQLSVI